MHFGDSEGLHYDGLSAEEKAKINDHNYHAPNGESWDMVLQR